MGLIKCIAYITPTFNCVFFLEFRRPPEKKYTLNLHIHKKLQLGGQDSGCLAIAQYLSL